jgi:cellulose synthase/poly-beta-1,6-N-acetylglucosamine synthase-like glycosyltransferase
MRLSALLSLGPTPWSRSLTQDLDLGVRLLAGGWRNEYCSSVAVHQQGVVELRKLIRQRSRWFQGHLQSWRLLGLVVRAVPGAARLDLIYHLSSPALLLIASMLTASFLAGLADSTLMAIQGTNPFTWWGVLSYLLAFGPALAYIQVYRRSERGVAPLGWWQILLLAHQYVFYGLMWYAAGWIAVWRSLRGHTSWAKTDRVAELTPDQTATPDDTELTPGQTTAQVTS